MKGLWSGRSDISLQLFENIEIIKMRQSVQLLTILLEDCYTTYCYLGQSTSLEFFGMDLLSNLCIADFLASSLLHYCLCEQYLSTICFFCRSCIRRIPLPRHCILTIVILRLMHQKVLFLDLLLVTSSYIFVVMIFFIM